MLTNVTTTTEMTAPPGILERTGSERCSPGLAGTWEQLRRPGVQPAAHLSGVAQEGPSFSEGKCRRREGCVCAATIGPPPQTASRVAGALRPLHAGLSHRERRFRRDLSGFLGGARISRLYLGPKSPQFSVSQVTCRSICGPGALVSAVKKL